MSSVLQNANYILYNHALIVTSFLTQKIKFVVSSSVEGWLSFKKKTVVLPQGMQIKKLPLILMLS